MPPIPIFSCDGKVDRTDGKIRVLYVLPLGGVGGAEKYVLSLCRHHDKSRFEITVCILLSGDVVADEIALRGHEVIRLRMANGFDVFRASKLVGVIRKRKIDIVSIHGQNPLGKLFSLLGFPPAVIHTDHGTTLGSSVKRRRRVVCFNRLLTPFFRDFVAISENMRRSLRLRERVPERKITLIYNGVEVAAIPGSGTSREDARRSAGIPPGVPLLGSVGRLAPEKQYDLLLESLSLLKRKNVEFLAIIVGDGSQKEYLERLVLDMDLGDRVRLLGERKDVPELMDIMDVFVFSSGGEAFSLTILEAMARAKPIVAYDVEGVNEAVVPGKTGFLVPFGDVEGFAERVGALLQAPEEAGKMGRCGYERVNTLFNITDNVRKVEALYERICDEDCIVR